jgi:Cytochrome C and Quinol oxidase polypeptide I
VGGKLRYTTSMLFALAFIPQFLVGGLTGILVATPGIDYQVNNSYFVLGHFHYTLFAGSVSGFFAGFYLWFPKATGIMLRDGPGVRHLAAPVRRGPAHRRPPPGDSGPPAPPGKLAGPGRRCRPPDPWPSGR